MAATTRICSAIEEEEEVKVARWRRLSELGLEEALCESGFSAAEIVEIKEWNYGYERIMLSDLCRNFDLQGRSWSKDDWKCSVVLATLGRGTDSPLKHLDVSAPKQTTKVEGEDVSNALCSSEIHLGLDEASALCINLSSNTNLRVLTIAHQRVFGTLQGCTSLARALETNSDLKQLELFSIPKWSSKGLKFFMDQMEGNTTIQHLNMNGNSFSFEQIGYVAEMLGANAGLRTLKMHSTGITFEGATLLSHALAKNSTLECIDLGRNAFGQEGMKTLLAVLTPDPQGDVVAGLRTTTSRPRNNNTTLKELGLDFMSRRDFSVESLASMIRTNKSLCHLRLRDAPLETRDWLDQIIPALEENETLLHLNLLYARGLSPDVFDPLMDLIRFSNTALESINLGRTEMSYSGKAGLLNEELRVNREHRSKLRGLREVHPKSGRLVICGYESAGKNRIWKTMESIGMGNEKMDQPRKKILRRKLPAGVQQLFFGSRSLTEFTERSREGFDILLPKDEPNASSFLWDFTGKRERCSAQDHFFPNFRDSCFVCVCCPMISPRFDKKLAGGGMLKGKEQMRAEFMYWMRLIASNSKPLRDECGLKQLPLVAFVLTSKDRLSPRTLKIAVMRVKDIILDLEEKFREVITLSEVIEVVNPSSIRDVEGLLARMETRLARLLQHSKEYSVCQELRSLLQRWLTPQSVFNPVLSLKTLQSLCEKELKASSSRLPQEYNDKGAWLHSREGLETVLAYLNDAGAIIFHKTAEFIVVDPKWLWVSLVALLVNAFQAPSLQPSTVLLGCPQGCFVRCHKDAARQLRRLDDEHEQGFVSREDIEQILEDSSNEMMMHDQDTLTSTQLIQLLILAEVCFETNPGEADSKFFIPAMLGNNPPNETTDSCKRKLEWKLSRKQGFTSRSHHYIGRRLQCENNLLTFLTPGFFPRLQVALRNYIHDRGWADNEFFRVDRDLIGFEHNGIELLVQYNDDCGGRDLEYHHSVDVLAMSFRPCEETLLFLEEHVVGKIRDVCASPQGCPGVVLVEAAIRPSCVQYPHQWRDASADRRRKQCVPLSFLKEKLDKDIRKSYRHAWEEETLNENTDIPKFDYALDLLDGAGAYEKFRGRASSSSVKQFHRRQASFLPPTTSASASSSSAVNASIVQLLNHFYLTIEDVGFRTKFVAGLNLSQVVPFQFHLMCCGEHGFHEVDNQKGRTLHVRYSDTRMNLPLIKYGANLCLAAVKIGAGTVGMPLDFMWLDSLIKKLHVDEMPDHITITSLDRMMNPGPAKESGHSEAEILSLLKRYIKADPSSQWLRDFLNLEHRDGRKKFFDDFRLQRVDMDWLCEECYASYIRGGRTILI